MGPLQRQLLRAVLCVVSRPRITLLLAGVVLAASLTLAAMKLTISADQNKLFDPRVSFFKDYLHFIRSFPENEAVYVVVQQRAQQQRIPNTRWTGIADAISDRLSKIPAAVRAVDAHIPIDRLGAQGLVFDDASRVRQSFNDVKQMVPLVKVVVEKSALKALFLGGTPLERLLASLERAPADPATATFAALLANSLDYAVTHDGALRPGAGLPDLASLDAADPSRLGYYFVPDALDPTQHLLLVRVYPNSKFDSLTAISETIEAIDATVREVADAYPEFTVGLTGRPALDADELRTTDRDSHKAEALALLAVFIGLVVALRSVWLAIVGEIALGVGIGWTFGWATLSVGELNLLSIVFLLALIGIGMDYLVQILMRYRRESARRRDAKRIWVAVFRHVAAPINTACIGAAGAFLVSKLTDFRGAAELGVIAGGGLLLCLIAGYTVLPALLTLMPVRRPRGLAKVERPLRKSRPLARWAALLLPLIWCGLLAAGYPYASRAKFNPNLLSLQAPGHQSVSLVRHLQTWSAVVLSKDYHTLRNVRSAVSASPLVASTDSLLNVSDNLDYLRDHAAELPGVQWADAKPIGAGTLASVAGKSRALAAKIVGFEPAAAASLNHLAATLGDAKGATRDRMVARLLEWQTGFLAQLRRSLDSFALKSPDFETMPSELRSHFVSAAGEFALYIYPKGDLWDQTKLNEFAQDIEARVATVADAPPPTGIAINLYHSTASIEHSFYGATGYALGLIVLLVLIDLRRIGLTLLAISVLAFGLPMLVIVMGLLRVDWNFANFFALPILIGAGHEYGVFLVHRYIEARDYPRRPWRSWDVSDRALLLCAYVTCTSFGFFWVLASHRGLRSLGLVMTVGIACIYLASIFVVRPVLKWKLGGRVQSLPT